MKNGFRVMDSDLHTMEPDGLWERYLDEPFKSFAPKFERRPEQSPNQPIIRIGALALGEMSKRPRGAAVGKSLHHPILRALSPLRRRASHAFRIHHSFVFLAVF